MNVTPAHAARRHPLAVVVPDGTDELAAATRQRLCWVAEAAVADGRSVFEIPVGTARLGCAGTRVVEASPTGPSVPAGPGVLAPGFLLVERLARAVDLGCHTVLAPELGGLLWAAAALRRQRHAFSEVALVVVGPTGAQHRANNQRRIERVDEAVGDRLEAAVAEQCAARLAADASDAAWLAAVDAPPAPLPAAGGAVAAITAIITHYERPMLLRRAIDSLLGQTRRPDELLVVDDGSASAAARTLLEELERLPTTVPLRVVRQANAGLGAARNHGVAEARHDVVAFLDDDDEAEPTYLERMAAAMTATGASAVAVGFSVFPDARGSLAALDPASLWLFAAEAAALSAVDNFIGGAAAMFRREHLQAGGGVHTQRGLAYEDWHVLVRLFLAGHRVETVPEPLLRYRVAATSMLRSYPVLASHDLVLDAFAEALPAALRSWPELLCGFATAPVAPSAADETERALSELRAAHAQLEAEVLRLRAIEAHHAAVLSSTSWRLGRSVVAGAGRVRSRLPRTGTPQP